MIQNENLGKIKTVSPVDWTVAGQAAHSTQRRIKLNLWAAIFSRHTSANLKRNIKNPLRCILPDAFMLLVRLKDIDWASWTYFIFVQLGQLRLNPPDLAQSAVSG